MMRVSIAGGSGYVGGELARLVLGHPGLELAQVSSERSAGQYLSSAHPNLRGRSDLRFCPIAALEPADALLLALPHGHSSRQIGRFADLAQTVVDLAADFRLDTADSYEHWYGEPHASPDWLERFTYGLPELHRERLAGARYASGVGCNATACTLALLPLARAGVLDEARGIVCDVKVGSSEGGAAWGAGSHHPVRSGVVRTYAPAGHRHTAEVRRNLEIENVHLSVTAIEMVRGASATCHAWLSQELSEKDLWKLYRDAWTNEPFVRIVHEQKGSWRHPEPKILAGSNYADVGWALDLEHGRIVAFGAIDNLMKGAAGSALQSLNLMLGLDEGSGLDFPGLHPV